MIADDTPLADIAIIPASLHKPLERLELRTVNDLLTHYPRRHEDRTQFDRFPSGETEMPVCVRGVITKTALKRFGGNRKMFDATFEEIEAGALSSPLILRWYNMHYIQKLIAVGQTVIVYGRTRLRGRNLCIEHPEFEIADEGETAGENLNMNRIVPIYPATEGITQRILRRVVFDVLSDTKRMETPLPEELIDSSRLEALKAIHFPNSLEQLETARRHLVLTEFFGIQLIVAQRRARTLSASGAPHCGPGKLLDGFLANLPFPPTGAQKRAIAEIRRDLASDHPMNRLLQGDVGSGKTLVALSAMLLAVESGCQAALMAPTQILAEQHYLNFCRLLEPLGISVALRTGARKEESGGSIMGSSRVSRDESGAPALFVEYPNDLPEAISYSRRSLPHFERPWAKYAISFSTRNRRKLTPEARDIVLDCLIHWKDKRYELYAACVMPDHVHLLIEPFVKDRNDKGDPVFYSIAEILHTIKSLTAHQINKLERMTGSVWQEESFDRLVRSERDLQEKYHYIVQNPWESDVVTSEEGYQWVWFPGCEKAVARAATSSASRRLQQASGLPSPARSHAVSAQILIGTHALLYDSAQNDLPGLGLVVIDEQHKFGVLQRAKLISRNPAPDVLVMTATPIPRTLTLTAYGDLDVSILDELPPGRGRIRTELRENGKLRDPDKFKEYLASGRQAYIVCPVIDESETKEVKAAAVEFEKWSKFLAPLKCELLHGRIAPDEKDAIMRRFRDGKTNVLVATTVIEVGIDVPNATVMIIENAEKFGLAQLHQLRGRIGRGSNTSYCILLAGTADETALEKLRVLARTSDGFEIAEADLELRGPGDILGTAQSGFPPLKIGNILRDGDLMRLAREAASRIVSADPKLSAPENQRFRLFSVESSHKLLSHVS
ncbi:MAG TPA: helicase-related protein [Chthoniobacterales bacterium]